MGPGFSSQRASGRRRMDASSNEVRAYQPAQYWDLALYTVVMVGIFLALIFWHY